MKYFKFLFSPALMGILFVVFALSMAVATFLENDFGSPAAYSMVYNTFWFELILVLLTVNLIGRMFTQKLYRREKLPVFLFHLSFVIMVAGAAITRYMGWEGTIHIREGEEQANCYSSEKYIGYSVKDKDGKVLENNQVRYTLTSVSADNYSKTVTLNGKEYSLALSKIIPNAEEEITETPSGEPFISLYVSQGMMSNEILLLKKGDKVQTHGITIGFASAEPADVNVSYESGAFFISSGFDIGSTDMNTQESQVSAPGNFLEMKPMQVVTVKGVRIVPQRMSGSATLNAIAVNPRERSTGQNAFVFTLTGGQETFTANLWDKQGELPATGSIRVEDKVVELFYGSKVTTLPFKIKLNDFILERYPGSNSPSGYKSDVILIDQQAGVQKPFMIFMNNILKYKGYRFYQSSYDQDEKGTILSVNHDMAGMLVTYSGYGLLFIFIIFSLISRNTVFYSVTPGYWNSNIRKYVQSFIIVLLLSGLTAAKAQKLVPDKAVSQEFGKILVQDQKGRTKPLFTLSNDILRKVARENELEGLTPMQVFLGLYLDFDHWKDVPLIRVSNREIQQQLGIRGNMAAFSDVVKLDGSGTYTIGESVNAAYAKAPAERNKTDKELMKVDERVNIVYMISQGEFVKLFPLKDGSDKWGSAEAALKNFSGREDSLYLKGIIPAFSSAVANNNAAAARQIAASIGEYQRKFTKYNLPSQTRINAEVLYYKLSIFERLFPFYATVGLVMLIGLITMVIRGRKEGTLFIRVMGWIIVAGFLFHTFGFVLRWYISGRSPMSNGYESMIFISWVTILAGIIFSRKSAFALSATAVLASMTLMVAHLSFMDPEITNLVPVLKSYWLTLHVSVITGSYGFLGLGAILSLISMILLVLSNDRNRERISNTIDELTVINFRTLTLGLYFITIGTFLGAVWANESWGRYWGWDPKETWSLITIVVYSIVIHSRNIPGMKDLFTFNLISLFAFSSVLMTYFGVNYYLSGMHSYASGDPVPVPSFVYVAVVLLTLISLVAYYKYNSFRKPEELKKEK